MSYPQSLELLTRIDHIFVFSTYREIKSHILITVEIFCEMNKMKCHCLLLI